MEQLAEQDFGIDYKEIFSLSKIDENWPLNLKNQLDNFDDLGLVDPLADDRSILPNLMKQMDKDKIENDIEVYYKTGKDELTRPQLCMFFPTEDFTRKIIRAICSQKDNEHPTFFLKKFGF